MGPELKKSSEVAVVPAGNTALSTEMTNMFAADANMGLENVRPEDLVVPFVTIVQKTSPQVDEANGKYIEGIKIGQLLESGTLAAYDSVNIVPCYYKTAIVEWHPRETGGGFVAQHEPGYEKQFLLNERGQWVTDSGTLLVQTMYFFCLLLQPDGNNMRVVFSFTSSQLKKGRTWVTRLISKKLTDASGKKFQPPIYESVWTVSTVAESNDKGNWRGYKIDVLKQVDSVELFKEAQKARAMFQTNAVVKPQEAVEGNE